MKCRLSKARAPELFWRFLSDILQTITKCSSGPETTAYQSGVNCLNQDFQDYSKAEKYVNRLGFGPASPAGEVLRRTRPNAICIPNLANSRVKVIIGFTIKDFQDNSSETRMWRILSFCDAMRREWKQGVSILRRGCKPRQRRRRVCRYPQGVSLRKCQLIFGFYYKYLDLIL